MPRWILSIALALLMTACGRTPAEPGPTTTSTAPTTVVQPAPDEEVVNTTTTITLADEARPSLEQIGRSVEGRPLLAATLGSGASRIYVVGSIHGDERTAVENSRELLAHAASNHPEAVTIRWLVDANPDGSATDQRDNAHLVDLNRNWPTGHVPSDSHGSTPLSEPESVAVAADIESFDPHIIVAFHSAREGPFANWDGPGETPARAFAGGASDDREWEVVSVVDWPTPGSLGTHYGSLGVPVVTVEGNRWDDPAAMREEMERGLDALVRLVGGLSAPRRGADCVGHSIGNTCGELGRRIEQLVSNRVSGGTTGYILKEAGGRVLAARWADYPTYPASSIKAIHHLAVVQAGAPALDDFVVLPADGCSGEGAVGTMRLESLDRLMMIESDNTAANAIQAHLGIEALQELALSAGMADTMLAHGFGCGGRANRPANSSTAIDLARLYDGIATGALLDEAGRGRFIDGMLDITATVGESLDVDLPVGTRIVAKAGWYQRDRSIAGIAQLPAGDFVFAAYFDRPHGLRDGFTIEHLVAELLRDLLVRGG